MLHIAICDDQPAEQQAIRYAAEVFFSRAADCTAEFHDFTSSMDLLDYLERGGLCDIALLDICMPGIDGLNVARQLKERRNRTEVIFLTADSEFAVDAFALKATHYIVKPFTQAQMDEALNRALKAFQPGEPKKLVLQGESGVLRVVETETILYAENFRHYLAVYTSAGELKETRRTLTVLAEELEQLHPGVFIQPYRGYIVNQNAIRAITKEGILLRSGAKIPIKAGSFRKLRDAYFDWAFRKVEENT